MLFRSTYQMQSGDTEGTVSFSISFSDLASNAGTPVSSTTNSSSVSFDKTAPVITLNGANPQIVILNNSYTELNATASDNLDGDVSSHIVTNSTAVNVNVQGSYPVTYSIADSSGNSAVEIRYVSVVVGTPPVINLNGASTINLVKKIGRAHV